MLFNSIDFAVFLPVVFILYWCANKNLKSQNLLLLIASYFFYASWDWRFLSLILFTTIIDFSIGLLLRNEEKPSKRKLLLWTSIIINLGFLGYFKYSNFFIENFIATFTFFGFQITAPSLNIILPVGISFYTFQTLSYTIDVYRKKTQPISGFIAFSAFVSFFPQLVAGPIERATNLLPQFNKKRKFNYTLAVDGMRQILWGLFKKIVIADNCALYANEIFNNSTDYSASTLIFGVICFSFQIYGDFSGYSDMAIGTSRLFGFNLKQNFAFPYFSRDIAEFWRRWHISLSTWFRDYLYIPLGGSKVGTIKKVRNILIVFVVSGFWHGANWTFIVWGILNALYILPLMLNKSNRKHIAIVAQGKLIPSFREFITICITFSLTAFAWIFFRAENLNHAFIFIARLLTTKFTTPEILPLFTIFIISCFILIEWLGRERHYAIAIVDTLNNRAYRWFIYLTLCFLIFIYHGEPQEFIYFKF